MVKKEFIIEKINLITGGIEKLEQFSGLTFSEAAGDYFKYSAIKNIWRFTEEIFR